MAKNRALRIFMNIRDSSSSRACGTPQNDCVYEFFRSRLEVEGDDMRKLIANLTENARLFAETRKLLGSSGKVLEVVEDEQEQAPEVAGEFYPASANGSSATEPTEAASPAETSPEGTRLKITPRQSFPRKRESGWFRTGLDPRLRGGDNNGDFHLLGWAAGS
jgi:hypothetical protein